MNYYQIAIITVVLSILQATVFALPVLGISLQLIFILAWILILGESYTKAAIFAFAGALLVDLLRLDNFGVMAFALLISMSLFVLLQSVVSAKNNIFSYLVALVMMFIGMVLLRVLYSLNSGLSLDSSVFGGQFFISVVFNWVLTVIFSILTKSLSNSNNSISFAKKR